jgi:hypothetical protein
MGKAGQNICQETDYIQYQYSSSLIYLGGGAGGVISAHSFIGSLCCWTSAAATATRDLHLQ